MVLISQVSVWVVAWALVFVKSIVMDSENDVEARLGTPTVAEIPVVIDMPEVTVHEKELEVDLDLVNSKEAA